MIYYTTEDSVNKPTKILEGDVICFVTVKDIAIILSAKMTKTEWVCKCLFSDNEIVSISFSLNNLEQYDDYTS